jgi:hypothetical protein
MLSRQAQRVELARLLNAPPRTTRFLRDQPVGAAKRILNFGQSFMLGIFQALQPREGCRKVGMSGVV